tara:strand:+ start:291 stop:1406 length:1116 start_codon:yes stop_codon:yes gene_type:complete
VRYCAKNGLNVFYDGLNPLAGLGGGAPGDRVEQGELPQSTLANNTAGLLKPDWTSPWLDKLHLLEELPSTRIIDLLQSMPFNFGVNEDDKKKSHPPPAPQAAYPEGEYPEWLRPSPPPSPPPPPPPSAQCGPGCAFGLLFLLVFVPTIAARTGMISQPTLQRFLLRVPSPLRSVLAALFGVDLSANALKVSPRARGPNPDPEEDAALVPEAESGKRGKRKEKSSKRKKGKLLALTQPDNMLDDADDSEDEQAPRGRSSRPGSTPLLTAQTPPSTGKEPASSRPGRTAADKSDRDKTERPKSRERDNTATAAPKVKGRAKEEGKLPKARKGKGGARDEEVEIPLRITCNQYRKFAEEDEPKNSRARRIAGVD